MVILYHLSAALDDAVMKALGPDPLIVNITEPAFDGKYKHPKSIESVDVRVRTMLDSTPGSAGADYTLNRVCLVGFSEGCQAIRAHLYTGAQPWGVVLIDGAHSSWPSAAEAFEILPYRLAFLRGMTGSHLFVGTHSGLTYVETLPKPYASTRTTLARITKMEMGEGEPDIQIVGKAAYIYSYGIVSKAEAAELGMTDTWKASHIKQARKVLPLVLQADVAPRLRDGGSAPRTEPHTVTFLEPPAPEPPAQFIPLGERCLAWCMEHIGEAEKPAGSNDSRLIREWRLPCVRGDGAKAFKLNLRPSNWCSMFQCAAMEACLEPGEPAPHGYRAGVVELVEDTAPGRDGRVPYAGDYRPVSEVKRGAWRPAPGDLVIFDRSDPNNPKSAWKRHVARVVSFDAEEWTFRTVGGNERDEVRLSEHHIGEARLLGFIEYPRPLARTTCELTETERADVEATAALFWTEYLDELSKGFHHGG
jgi:hypothetical protein